MSVMSVLQNESPENVATDDGAFPENYIYDEPNDLK